MAVNERQDHVADANKMVKSAESAKQNINNSTILNGTITGPSPKKSPRALKKVNFKKVQSSGSLLNNEPE